MIVSSKPKTSVNVGPPPDAPVDKTVRAPKNDVGSKRRLQLSIPESRFLTDNLSKPSDDIADMNFKVASDFHRRFKTEATIRGLSMKELLEESFKCYLDKNGAAYDEDLFRRSK